MRIIIKAMCFLSASLLLLSFIECDRSADDAVASRITGKWQWERTVIPYGGQTSNPGTAGYTRTLEFSAHGIMRELRNDSLVQTTNYWIQADSPDPELFILIYDGFSYHCSISGDKLEFNEAYVDGPIIFFTRIR
jgi:hypothetical protein